MECYKMKKYLTFKETLAQFKADILPGICETEKQYANGVDDIMRREEFNNFTDYLCKAGMISSEQYETWDNPF